MKMQLINLSIISNILFGALQASAGNGVGGGGFAVLVQSQWRFLDLALSSSPRAQCDAPGYRMPDLDREMEDWIRFYHRIPRVSSDLERLMQKWDRLNPEFNQVFRQALNEIEFQLNPFSMTWRQERGQERYHVPKNFAAEMIKVIAWYTPSVDDGFSYRMINGRVEISAPDYEKLCRIDQVALLVHETLRSIQLSFLARVDTEKLQKMTEAYVTQHDPNRLLNFAHVGGLRSSKKASSWRKKVSGFDYTRAPQETYRYAQRSELLKLGQSPHERLRLEQSRSRVCVALISARKITDVRDEDSVLRGFRAQSLERVIESIRVCYRNNGYPKLMDWRVRRELMALKKESPFTKASKLYLDFSIGDLSEAIFRSRQ